MCEDYFLYFEEIDWVLRGRKKGFNPAFAIDSIVFHKQGVSSGVDDGAKTKSEISDYTYLKNRLKFAKRFFKSYLLFVYLGLVLSGIYRVLKGNYIGAYRVVKVLINRA